MLSSFGVFNMPALDLKNNIKDLFQTIITAFKGKSWFTESTGGFTVILEQIQFSHCSL